MARVQLDRKNDTVVNAHFSGRLTDEELHASMIEILHATKEQDTTLQMADMRDASLDNISNAALEKLARVFRSQSASHDSKTAVVVGSDMDAMVAGTYKVLCESKDRIKLFDDPRIAEKWLFSPLVQ